MTVSQREINDVSPSLVVMCVRYKNVSRQKQLQHCLRQLHANGWLLSVMVQLNISSIRVATAAHVVPHAVTGVAAAIPRRV